MREEASAPNLQAHGLPYQIEASSNQPFAVHFNAKAAAALQYMIDVQTSGALADLCSSSVAVLWLMLTQIEPGCLPRLIVRCSQGWIADELKKCPGYVERVLRQLRMAGLLERRKRGGGHALNIYELLPCRPQAHRTGKRSDQRRRWLSSISHGRPIPAPALGISSAPALDINPAPALDLQPSPAPARSISPAPALATVSASAGNAGDTLLENVVVVKDSNNTPLTTNRAAPAEPIRDSVVVGELEKFGIWPDVVAELVLLPTTTRELARAAIIQAQGKGIENPPVIAASLLRNPERIHARNVSKARAQISAAAVASFERKPQPIDEAGLKEIARLGLEALAKAKAGEA